DDGDPTVALIPPPKAEARRAPGPPCLINSRSLITALCRPADERFLAFFFHRLQPNRSGRYEDSFPFVSPCGAERNFVRCQDLPVVFTRVLEGENGGGSLLSYCGGGSRLALPFQPESLTFDPENGRLYHPGPEG
ncbi:UPF0598 protein C8orf82 homolog, partial [Lagopus leucura]|uniref:UPF0598 protein C8orf82 homolog n=1 Tax=Lagopus leucura TaxID=30410 RepID=UPI001C67585A